MQVLLEQLSQMSLLATAVVGLLASLIGATIGPLINWGIEKKRRRRERRRKQIAEWRNIVSEVMRDQIREFTDDEFESGRKYLQTDTRSMLKSHAGFHSLKRHLSNETKDFLAGERKMTSEEGESYDQINRILERQNMMSVSINMPDPVLQLIIADIDTLEREWNLI